MLQFLLVGGGGKKLVTGDLSRADSNVWRGKKGYLTCLDVVFTSASFHKG